MMYEHVFLKCISNLHKYFLNKIHFAKLITVNSGRKSSEIQFPVPVKPELEQGFQILVPDILEPECQKIYSTSGSKNQIVFAQIRYPVPFLKKN